MSHYWTVCSDLLQRGQMGWGMHTMYKNSGTGTQWCCILFWSDTTVFGVRMDVVVDKHITHHSINGLQITLLLLKPALINIFVLIKDRKYNVKSSKEHYSIFQLFVLVFWTWTLLYWFTAFIYCFHWHLNALNVLKGNGVYICFLFHIIWLLSRANMVKKKRKKSVLFTKTLLNVCFYHHQLRATWAQLTFFVFIIASSLSVNMTGCLKSRLQKGNSPPPPSLTITS